MKHLLIATLMMIAAQAADLRVTVYGQASLPKEVSKSAFTDLRQIFRESGIDIEFVTGNPTSAEASLLTSPATPRKGTERVFACRARRDIALELVANFPAVRKGTILGMAEPFASEGLNARIFNDHVLDAANRQGRRHASVLAHAIAHEIGHVLLRSSVHTSRGLMSAVWGDHEYGTMARSLMFFNSNQAKAMRAVLSRENCQSTPSTEILSQK